eukprot:5214157-Amphidinium_carterae.1
MFARVWIVSLTDKIQSSGLNFCTRYAAKMHLNGVEDGEEQIQHVNGGTRTSLFGITVRIPIRFKTHHQDIRNNDAGNDCVTSTEAMKRLGQG